MITRADTALLTSYGVRNADLSRGRRRPRDGTIQDAIFQEIDLASGRVLLEWHSLDHIALSESYAPVGADWDFFHINSVDLDRDGNLLVSSRSTHTVYKLDRSGTIVWRLGGKHSDFEHRPRRRVRLAARRPPPARWNADDLRQRRHARRRAALPRPDPRRSTSSAMTATLVRQYTHPRRPPILSGSQGSVQLLANGNVFVGWGEAPHVSEFDCSGRMLFDAVLGRSYQSYRAFRLPWSGQPAEAPAIAVDGEGRHRTAYASWNGATEVAAWQLLQGPRGGALQAVSQVSAGGFESSLPAAGSGPCLAVRALDAGGGTLGQSRSLSVAA